jgi:hypothetical protein
MTPNFPKVAKKWSWPLSAPPGMKSSIDHARRIWSKNMPPRRRREVARWRTRSARRRRRWCMLMQLPSSRPQPRSVSAYTEPERCLCRSPPLGMARTKASSMAGLLDTTPKRATALRSHVAAHCAGAPQGAASTTGAASEVPPSGATASITAASERESSAASFVSASSSTAASCSPASAGAGLEQPTMNAEATRQYASAGRTIRQYAHRAGRGVKRAVDSRHGSHSPPASCDNDASPVPRVALLRRAAFVALGTALLGCGAKSDLAVEPEAVVPSAPAPACSCSVCRTSCRGTATGCRENELCRGGVCRELCSDSSPTCATCVTTLDCDVPVQVCR